ncbi:MAG: DUF1853 family protein [Janthinobacterium lividum]
MSQPADTGDCFAPLDPAIVGNAPARAAAPGAALPDAARCAVARGAFRVPAVRDLCWLMASPALLSQAMFGEQLASPADTGCFGPDAPAALQRLLARLEADPAPLRDALAATPERRLGRYAERLLAVWLAQMPGVDVVALGLPVRDAGRTLGECDALFRTAQGDREHWEMAVKFYLRIDAGLPDADDAVSPSGPASPASADGAAGLFAGCDAYVGAGLADRLDWKLRRLVEHQMPLSERAELIALGGGPWRARMLVKGRLFHPLAQWRAPLPGVAPGDDIGGGIGDGSGVGNGICGGVGSDLSSGGGSGISSGGSGISGGSGGMDAAPALAPDHLRGWWATYDDWCAASARSTLRWTPLARLEWLAPLQSDAARAQSASDFARWLAEHFADAADGAGRRNGQEAGREAGQGASPKASPKASPEATLEAARGAGQPIQVAALGPGAGVEAFSESSRGFIVPNDWPERARRFRQTGRRYHQ